MEQHLTPLDQSFFKDIQLDYFPETTGFSPYYPERELSIFPNPGAGIFTIDMIPENTIEITVLTSNGKELLKYDKRSITNIKKLTIDLTSYQRGIYLLRYEIDNRIITKKFIKQ